MPALADRRSVHLPSCQKPSATKLSATTATAAVKASCRPRQGEKESEVRVSRGRSLAEIGHYFVGTRLPGSILTVLTAPSGMSAGGAVILAADWQDPAVHSRITKSST